MTVAAGKTRHRWDKPAGSFERTCGRCGATIRKYTDHRGYQYWPRGLDYRSDRYPAGWVHYTETIPACEGPPRPAVPALAVTIGRVTYAVERRERTPAGQPEVTYHLTGPRGAQYRTIRNVPNPDLMFLVNDRPGSYKAPKAWLTDRAGPLEVIR